MFDTLYGEYKHALREDTLKNAQDFIAFLLENEMIPGKPHGEVSYKDKTVCYIHMDGSTQRPGPWTVWPEGEYSRVREDVPMDDRMKELAKAHVNFCENCGAGCNPGRQQTILGQPYDHVCQAVMAFTDPNAEALECLKLLIKMRKCFIDEI